MLWELPCHCIFLTEKKRRCWGRAPDLMHGTCSDYIQDLQISDSFSRACLISTFITVILIHPENDIPSLEEGEAFYSKFPLKTSKLCPYEKFIPINIFPTKLNTFLVNYGYDYGFSFYSWNWWAPICSPPCFCLGLP